MGGRGDGASVGHDVLAGQVFFQFKDEDVIVAVLVSVANLHVPHPKVRVALTDGPVAVAATVVFDDGDVAGFTSWSTLVVGLERVVLLVNHDVDGAVAGELTHFHLLNVSKFIPVCVSALISGDPDVLSLVEVSIAVVVENRHAVRTVGRHSKVVVPIAVKIANGEVRRVAVCCVGACHRCAGRGGKSGGGAENHQQGQEDTSDSGLREVVLG